MDEDNSTFPLPEEPSDLLGERLTRTFAECPLTAEPSRTECEGVPPKVYFHQNMFYEGVLPPDSLGYWSPNRNRVADEPEQTMIHIPGFRLSSQHVFIYYINNVAGLILCFQVQGKLYVPLTFGR